MAAANKASNKKRRDSSERVAEAPRVDEAQTAIQDGLLQRILKKISQYLFSGNRSHNESTGVQAEASVDNDLAVDQQLIVAESPANEMSVLQRAAVSARSSLEDPVNKRRVSRFTLLIVAILIIAPISAWIRYQSLHVTSTNAIVRGHVTEIGTQLEGIVEAVEVDAGDRVFAGQVLALLDDRRLVAEAAEARANLQKLNRELEVERLEIELARRQIDQQLIEATANLSAAQAESVAAAVRAENAQRSYQLRKDLFAEGGAISGEDVRESDADRLTSKAMMRATEAQRVAAESARANTRLAVDALAIRERKVGILEAEIARTEAQVSKAEAALDGATVRAPQDGAIIRRIVQVGGSVDVGQPLISMRLGNDVWVEAWIDEEDIGDVRRGSKAVISLTSFSDQEFSGTVDKIGLTTDFEMPESDVPQPRFSRMRSTPVVGVRIKLDDPPLDLLPGLSAVVSISRHGG